MATAPTQIRIDAEIKKRPRIYSTISALTCPVLLIYFFINVFSEADFRLVLNSLVTVSAHLTLWTKPDAFPMILTSRDIPI